MRCGSVLSRQENEMTDIENQVDRLHREALAYYNAWLADRERRQREYGASVAEYHTSLAEGGRTKAGIKRADP